ncbi:hypothetical protein C8R47DRAFT_1154823, partial [Mycena vitilis]
MPKPWARERTKRRKAEAALRAEEEQSHPPLVSNPSPSVNYPVLALSIEKAWQHQFRGIRHPHGIVLNPHGYIHQQPLAAALPVDVAAQPLPRDFSALCSEFPHPWRTVRRHNLRLLSQHREHRPFPKSLAKRPVISAPRVAVLALRDSLPMSVPTLPTLPLEAGRSAQPAHLLGLMPLHPDDPIHPDDVASLAMPAPSLCPCPADHLVGLPVSLPLVLPPAPSPSSVPACTLPALTVYGPVQTRFAYACARELPGRVVTLEQVFGLIWGPLANKEHKDLLVKLPPDRLVFLCTLAAIAAMEPVFEGFLHPVIR